MGEPHPNIISDIRRGKSYAQRHLYEWLSGKMMAVCFRYAKNREDAEDILQDGFVKVFERFHMYDGSGSLEGWVRRIMVHTAIDHLRKQKNWGEKENLEQVVEEVSPDALDSLSLQELYRHVQALPPGYRAVFNLFAVEGFSHKEIAEQLGVEESTSRSQYVRARTILMKRIRVGSMEEKIYRDAI